MTPVLLYLTGAPATGKSTLMAELRSGYDLSPRETPLPHTILTDPRTATAHGAEIGRTRDRFSGTDALRMDIHPQACEWITRTTWPLVMAEGARLATRDFLDTAAQHRQVHLVHLEAEPETLDQRCAQRGSHQSTTWRRGATTRARNLADWAQEQHHVTLHRLNATHPTTELAAHLRQHLPERPAA